MNIYQRLTFIALFLCLILTSLSNGQEKTTCSSCKEEITNSYIEAAGRHFHPSHFKCSRCGNVIKGSFGEKDGRFYHPDCYAASEGFVCGKCSKAIEGKYYEDNGKKYHAECYKNSVAAKCAVCGYPLLGEYTADMYGNKYHPEHENELDECDNCGRIISRSTTNGGRSYSDGRHICSLCSNTDPVYDISRFNALLSKVMLRLKTLGLRLNDKSISIKGVDRKELKKVAGSSYDKNMHGFCLTNTQTAYMGNKVIKNEKKHLIYVLNGVPALNVESVIAHELMHVWLNENTHANHPAQIREGSCNYISYLYLKSLGTQEAKQIIRMLENNPDYVYGKGFDKIRSGYDNRNLGELLNYLKK